MPLQPFAAILFDLDGTLVDSVGDLATALNLLRDELTLHRLPREAVEQAVGDGATLLLTRTLKELPDPAAQLPRFLEIYREHLTETTRPYDGIVELVSDLQGTPLGIVSNKPHALTVELVQGLELGHHFGAILGADGGPKKPEPEPLLRACTLLGVTPESILMVGDHHTDLLAGRAAGCATCFCSWGIGNDGGIEPDYRVTTVAELRRLLIP